MCFLQYFTQFIHILMVEINRCLNPIHPITSLKRINYKKHMLLSFPKQNRESSYFALMTENIEKIKKSQTRLIYGQGTRISLAQ